MDNQKRCPATFMALAIVSGLEDANNLQNESIWDDLMELKVSQSNILSLNPLMLDEPTRAFWPTFCIEILLRNVKHFGFFTLKLVVKLYPTMKAKFPKPLL